jgi:hypothetical protein
MKKRLLACLIAWMGALSNASLAQAAPNVSFADLLGQVTNLDRLAEFPEPYYLTRMASSFDRRSTDPAIQNETNWLANTDFVNRTDLQQFVRIETRDGRKEYVLMDEEGPGAIVRIWSAQAEKAGDVRIYLDGSATPTIEMPLTNMLGGASFPFVSPLSGVRSLGWNCNLPIPYARHCKVTTSRAEDTYWYQITYRVYPSATVVEPFSLKLAQQHRAEIEAVAQALKHPAGLTAQPGSGRKTTRQEKGAELASGQSLVLALAGRDQAIYGLTCQVSSTNPEEALRGCLLEMSFDARPTVHAPLGDFFATAPGLNPYVSLPCDVRAEGTLSSRWVMPFRESAEIKVTNASSAPVKLNLVAISGDRVWTPHTLYFHAATRLSPALRSQPRRDWNYIEITGGRGRYLGNMLHVANANRDWWGEGDEKIYFEGEKFPRIFGTGTEDYYGYACCSPALFSHAYHNQSRCDGPGNSGHTCLSRFHVLDDLPFQNALRFDMEIWHWDDGEIHYGATSWWYGDPGTRQNLPALTATQLKVPVLPAPQDRRGRNLFEKKKKK